MLYYVLIFTFHENLRLSTRIYLNESTSYLAVWSAVVWQSCHHKQLDGRTSACLVSSSTVHYGHIYRWHLGFLLLGLVTLSNADVVIQDFLHAVKRKLEHLKQDGNKHSNLYWEGRSGQGRAG